MWTDTHGLLAVNPRTWHMGSLAVNVWDVAKRGDPAWDVAKRGDPAPLSRMGKLVRQGRRILTGEIVTAHGPTGPRGVTVAHGYYSTAAQFF